MLTGEQFALRFQLLTPVCSFEDYQSPDTSRISGKTENPGMLGFHVAGIHRSRAGFHPA
jgi:hypothetical protein